MCARPNETHTAEGLQERRGAAARRPEEQRHRARLELDALGPGGQDGLPPLAPLANARRPPLGWSEPPLRLLSLEVPRREGSIPLIPDPPPRRGRGHFPLPKNRKFFSKTSRTLWSLWPFSQRWPPKKVFGRNFQRKSKSTRWAHFFPCAIFSCYHEEFGNELGLKVRSLAKLFGGGGLLSDLPLPLQLGPSLPKHTFLWVKG